MTAYTKKLLIAALISITGTLVSYGWFKMTATAKTAAATKVVAQLASEKNEVQRRPAKHVIWERVDEGESLHAGEAVRTASDSEAKILFNSGTEVDLDPDSVIVLEDNGDKVNLDFVKGNLFVKGGGAQDVALKSGNTSIVVADGELALGKQAGAKGVDVQVLRGSAEVKNGEKHMTLDQSKRGVISDEGMDVQNRFFKNVTPALNDKVFVKTSEAAKFKWTPLSADYNVRLEAGNKRDSLKPVGEIVSGDKGELKAQLKPGTQFYRLVAVSKKDPKEVHQGTESKVTVVATVAPKALAPQKNQVVTLTADTKKVSFSWANPSHLATLRLEVARDPMFKEIKANPVLTDATETTVDLAEDGDYYWRITGWRPGTQDGFSSEVLKFTLKAHFELAPPVVKGPVDGAHVPIESVNAGTASFAWNSEPGVSRFHVVVREDKEKDAQVVFDKEVNGVPQTKFPPLKPGKFKWTVAGVDESGKESPKSAEMKFTVEDVPVLPWADNLQQENFQYVTEKPMLKATWKKTEKPEYKSFRVTAKTDDGSPDSVATVSGGKEPEVNLPHDGLFHVTVEALDAAGNVVARSSARDFFVGSKPLLPAPSFGERAPASFQAQNNGSAKVAWQPVTGAHSYKIFVKDSSGHVVKKERSPSAIGTVKDLLPGNYKVSVSSVDEFGRAGPAGEEKALVVPDVSDVKPPAFKKLQIH